jgi:glycosyltransferase involved in cell wall biosynthesis
MSAKKTILLFTDWYEPGYRAGGPIRSCVNFVRAMKEDYSIYVFTSDRDWDASAPYENLARDQWIEAPGGVHLYYCSPDHLTWENIHRQMVFVGPDFIYLNSMFSKYFTIYPLLISHWNKLTARIILAPRGMLRQSALRFKTLKKRTFLSIFKGFGLPAKIHFHATDQTEVDDIRAHFGSSVKITLLSNFPGPLSHPPDPLEKNPGELSIIYVGRIHPIKNLDFLIRALQNVSGKLSLTVVGNMEDAEYWEKCEAIIRTLPSNITVTYTGEMPNEHLQSVLSRHHIFSLPTLGENFGHAIFEALCVGKPVLISDQTPWKGLAEKKAGWDLALNDPESFTRVIKQLTDLEQEAYNEFSRHAWKYADDFSKTNNLKEEYLKLFD